MLGGGSDPPQRLHHMLGGGSRPPQRLHHMLGGGRRVSRRAPPPLEAMCACSCRHPILASTPFLPTEYLVADGTDVAFGTFWHQLKACPRRARCQPLFCPSLANQLASAQRCEHIRCGQKLAPFREKSSGLSGSLRGASNVCLRRVQALACRRVRVCPPQHRGCTPPHRGCTPLLRLRLGRQRLYCKSVTSVPGI